MKPLLNDRLKKTRTQGFEAKAGGKKAARMWACERLRPRACT